MDTRLNILLVEDNPGDAELIKDMIFESRLKSSDIEEVHTLKDAITQVQNNNFDIILLDLGLPDSAGIDTLHDILKWSEDAPVIVFTGLDDEEAGLEAIGKGAQDYLVKGKVSSDMLARFVLYSIKRKKDAEKIYHLNSMLKAIRNVNQLIVKEKDVDELITSSCEILTKKREYLNACIILFDEKNKPYKSSMRRDTKGDNEFRTQVEKGTWNGTCQKALGIKGIQIVENAAVECRNCPLNKDIKESHVIAVRLEYGDKIYGVMSVRILREMAFDEEEQELLKEAAGDISFAIHDIEIEEERKQAEEQLKKELAEKEVLLREIRHRVKNNLQVISGLLHLQQREIKTKEDALKGFNASQDRLLAMAKAYEFLLGSEYMSDVSIGKYIESLAAQLKKNYDIHNKITLHYSMDELTVNIEILDRLALALNEIITNAIQYAFVERDSGNITIQVKGAGERFTIKISDDGTGIPEEVQTDNPATLGLSIISMIIGQLSGTLSIDRINGTCFILDIPHKKDEN